MKGTLMKLDVIKSMAQLREIYPAPKGLVIKKQKSALDDYTRQFLDLSAFAILSTSNALGVQDCSPRGDYPGFIQALDNNTIVIPDRPGNNRLDTLSNIIENPNVGLLVLIPGFKECLRINGRACIATNTDLLQKFKHQDKCPSSVIVLTISEIYFHCAKAITRSKLWDIASQVDRSVMPSLGEMLMKQIDPLTSDEEIKQVDQFIEGRVKTTLY